jgi:RHS repeat-associated protein
MNRKFEAYYPDATKDAFTYDKRGNLLEKKTYKSTILYQKIKYEYDALDHLIKVKEYPDVTSESYYTTLFEYNLNRDLIGFANANDTTGTSTEVKYAYDISRLFKTEYPDTTNDSLGFYKDSNIKFKRNRKGQVIGYTYDKRGRITKSKYYTSFSQYPSNPADSTVFNYNKVNNVVRMIDQNDTINYSYDEMDNLDTLDSYQSILTSYEYDVAGNKKKVKVVNYATTDTIYLEQSFPSYDEANRLEKTIVGTDTFYFNYWDTGQIKKIDYPNGIKEQCTLTSRNFIDVITDSTSSSELYKFEYDYNEVGDRKQLSFAMVRPRMPKLIGGISYKYDDIRRLTEVKYPKSIYGKANKYAYDKVGNRLKKIAGTDTTEYSYNGRNNQLNSEGLLKNYVYDDNGNLIKFNYGSGNDTLFYDFENRLIKFVNRALSIPPTKDSVWFNYCGMGKRIKKIEKPDGQNPDTVVYTYDGIYTVCEFGGHLDLKYKYVYANNLLLARYDKSPGDTSYYHHDGLGSVIGITRTDANSKQTYFYDEFGDSLGNWGYDNENHYLYTGQEYDGSITGFYNYRARYYENGIGRFITEDPLWNSLIEIRYFNLPGLEIVFAQDLNPYVYCCNNPLNMTDPSGKMPWGLWNWFGPEWTGGKEMYLEEMIEKKIQPKPPKNHPDWCAMKHDKCYFTCRQRRKAKLYNRLEGFGCLRRCDLILKFCLGFIP